jgi:CheY-like chemotaxis protein
MTVDFKKLDFVLLIDDDDVVNTLHTIILRQSGVTENIQSVMSGAEGLDTLSEYEKKSNWPAIIFVDINMPGMNGWEFLEIFKKKFSAHKQRCVICLLSSSLDPRDKEKADRLDMVDFYFSKPLSFDAVYTICKKYHNLNISISKLNNIAR